MSSNCKGALQDRQERDFLQRSIFTLVDLKERANLESSIIPRTPVFLVKLKTASQSLVDIKKRDNLELPIICRKPGLAVTFNLSYRILTSCPTNHANE